MSMDLIELQNIFEYELKRKLAQKCRTKNDELRFLLNSLRFYDYHSSPIIDKNKWIKGVQKTGLCGFNINDLSDVFSKYDPNNTGFINYKNFCYYINGIERFHPLSKNEIGNNLEMKNEISTNRLKSPFNDFKPPGLYDRNIEIIEDEERINSQRTPNKLPEISKNNNYNNINKDYYYKLIEKRSSSTPFQNFSNLNLNNNNYGKNLSIQNYNLSFENDSHYNKLLLLLRSKINTENGITYYTFAQKLKERENGKNKTIDFNSFYSSLRDINASSRINDLTDFFNYIDKNQSNNIPTENILKLIRGDLNDKRKKIIELSFSLIDKEKMGRVPIDLLKGLYNCKLHPDVYVGFKQEEDIYKEFCYTFDMYCILYNINKYITLEQFIDYYSGISPSIIDDNYFIDILNGVWNQNIIINKNMNSIIKDNLNINKNYNDNYKNELIGNRISRNNNYYLNNRYANSSDKNKYNYLNYQNKSNSNLIQNKSQYFSPYTPIPKENELNHERITPYYHPVKTPLYKGVKTFRSLIHNPITNEFTMNKDNTKTIGSYCEPSPIKQIKNYDYNDNNKNINLVNINKPIREIEKLREILISRGKRGIFMFQKIICLYDKEKTGNISYNKFNELLEIFNITIDKQSINSIFDYFDKEKKGIIKYDDLICEIIGNIDINREIIIKKIFDIFTKDKNSNNISIKELKQRYKAFNHPDVKNNIKTEKEVYFEFLESIDIFKNYKNNINGQNYNDDFLSYEEFLEYYKEISLSINDNREFENLLINCWNVDKSNNSNYINSFNEGNYSNNDNLRIRTANQILNNEFK